MASLRFFQLSTLLLLSLSMSIHAKKDAVVKMHGAVGDGTTYDTKAIQAAIDDSASGGGGYVVFPPGNYLTGTVYLKTGVFLVLQAGAKILAGTKVEDYPADSSKWYLILAEDAKDVSIGGDGEIDGQGLEFIQQANPIKNVMINWSGKGGCTGDICRPRLIGFKNCENVLYSKIKLTNSPSTALHFVKTSNITVADMSISADFNSPDTVGIDLEDSSHVVITRSHIDTAGDGIAIKSITAPAVDIVGTQTTIRTKSTAIKIGDASFFDFDQILFVDMTIIDAHRGVAMQVRDGGRITNATFTNMNVKTKYYDPSWVGRAEPIYVSACPRTPTSKPGSIDYVIFYNWQMESENGIVLSGANGGLVHTLKLVRHTMKYNPKGNVPDGFLDYGPGCRGLVPHKTSGVFMENADFVELEDFDIVTPNEQVATTPLDYNPENVAKVLKIRFKTNGNIQN
ncbi:hypothetical protein ACHQM5_022295 [Ranunculus cassubicifolius]